MSRNITVHVDASKRLGPQDEGLSGRKSVHCTHYRIDKDHSNAYAEWQRQGDSGHAQATMVTEVYSHILDDDRQHNAELFEETFYSGKTEDKKGAAPGGVGQSSDMEAIMRILKNPEAAKLLKSLLSALDN